MVRYTNAIPAAAGYPQYSGNLIPPIYSQTLIENFYCSTVFGDISTTEYIGEMRGKGDQITFFREPCVIVRDHVKDGTIKHDVLESDTVTLVIDRAKEFSYKIARLDADMMPMWDQMRSKLMQNTARTIADKIDCELLGEIYTYAHCDNQGPAAGCVSHSYNLGQTGNPVPVTSINVLEVITNVAAVLDEACIPKEGRYLVIPTPMKVAIMNSELRAAYFSGLSQSTYLNGKIADNIAGFAIYESNHVPRVFDAGANTWAWHIVAGIRSATCFASVVEHTREIEDKDSWDIYYQGLQAYGFGVIQPKALAHLYARFN
jgi:hypothetical protein